MNVFDLALDLGDKEWFERLQKISNNENFLDYEEAISKNNHFSLIYDGAENCIREEVDLQDMLRYLQVWDVRTVIDELTKTEVYENGITHNMNILDAFQNMIRSRRDFQLSIPNFDIS